jgi:hypothetical protein
LTVEVDGAETELTVTAADAVRTSPTAE